MPRSVSINQLNQLATSSLAIVDIREPHEFNHYHLPNAVNIPYQALVMYPERYLNRYDTYYLICGHGSVSHRAASMLESGGYRVVTIRGGYESMMRYRY